VHKLQTLHVRPIELDSRSSTGTPDRHDLEYPEIPSIPEESEEAEDQVVDFPEFSPEGDLGRNFTFSPILEEKSDASVLSDSSDFPWQGLLKKSSSKLSLNQN